MRHIRATVLDNLAALDNHVQLVAVEERFVRYVAELDVRQRGGTDVACQRTGAPAKTQQRHAHCEGVLVHLEVRGKLAIRVGKDDVLVWTLEEHMVADFCQTEHFVGSAVGVLESSGHIQVLVREAFGVHSGQFDLTGSGTRRQFRHLITKGDGLLPY